MQVVVVGATGVVGRAVGERCVELGWDVVGVSRRPVDVDGVRHVALDLADPRACETAVRGELRRATHVVYAALHEAPGLVAGWRDDAVAARNAAMFRHLLDPLLEHAPDLAHVTLLQGGKAYGLHLGRTPVPAKERTPRVEHENWYFAQEDHLRAASAGASWSWTVLRPTVVYGESFASPMNLVPAIGVYGALLRERGRPLAFPGGGRAVHDAVDARVLARAVTWAATAPAARGEIFNVTNGDVFDWHEVWPAIADALGMPVGDAEPTRLAEVMPPRAPEWAAIVDRWSLAAPRAMGDFVGDSWTYADLLLGAAAAPRPLPALLSTVKIRQAGFADCIDTEDMFRAWIDRFQRRRLLPPR